MPIVLADRVIALLGQLSAEDIERLPDAERRRLADQCRQMAQLAGRSRNDASSKAHGSADTQRDQGKGKPAKGK